MEGVWSPSLTSPDYDAEYAPGLEGRRCRCENEWTKPKQEDGKVEPALNPRIKLLREYSRSNCDGLETIVERQLKSLNAGHDDDDSQTGGRRNIKAMAYN